MGPPCTWKDFVRSLFVDPKFTERLDVFTAYDLRADLLKLVPGGEPLEVKDNEWTVLDDVARHPRTLSPQAVHSCRAMFEAICHAPTKKPAKEAPKKK
jgi:hypothetical protein